MTFTTTHLRNLYHLDEWPILTLLTLNVVKSCGYFSPGLF